MRRGIIVMPSIFTLTNLFFGVWSMILAAQGDFYRASWWIVIGGVFDNLDGRIARLSNTGSRFGAQLDSLADIVSFGVAPAMLVYYAFFSKMGGFAWVFSYAFVVCVALRLARFNLQSAETGENTFIGLPSPAAGMTLATYYPFTQTPFYEAQLATLPWSQILVFLTILLSTAMVSNVGYAKLPTIGVRTGKGVLGLLVILTVVAFGIWSRDIFFFPLGVAYLTYGIARAIILGMQERVEEENPDEVSPEHGRRRRGRSRGTQRGRGGWRNSK